MIIVGKSSVDKKQLISKKIYGINDLELQLLGSDFIKDFTDIYNDIISSDVNIVAVHLPLNVEGFGDLNMELFSCEECAEYFIKSCRLAQELADYYKHNINIIVHNGISLKKYLYMPDLFNKIISIFDYVLEIFPNITFSIENVLPFNFKNNDFECFDGGMFENVEIAKYLNKNCAKEVFFTTLDICHALYTLKTLDLFKNEDFAPKICLKDYFIKNKEYLNNIHFNNLRNWGYKGLEHGFYFDKNNEEDLTLAKEILDIYNELNLNAFLTLEVQDVDYTNCINFGKTLETIKLLLK